MKEQEQEQEYDVSIISTIGLTAAIMGAILTAMPNPRLARAGFACYLLSNLPLLAHALQIRDAHFAILYSAFTLLSTTGIVLRTEIGRQALRKLGAHYLLGERRSQDRDRVVGNITSTPEEQTTQKESA